MIFLFQGPFFALLWKALCIGSEAIISWILAILPIYISDSILSKEEIINECLIAITQRPKISQIIRFLFSITDDFIEYAYCFIYY